MKRLVRTVVLDLEFVAGRSTGRATSICSTGRIAGCYDVRSGGVRVHVGQAREAARLHVQLAARLIHSSDLRCLIVALDAETLMMQRLLLIREANASHIHCQFRILLFLTHRFHYLIRVNRTRILAMMLHGSLNRRKLKEKLSVSHLTA